MHPGCDWARQLQSSRGRSSETPRVGNYEVLPGRPAKRSSETARGVNTPKAIPALEFFCM